MSTTNNKDIRTRSYYLIKENYLHTLVLVDLNLALVQDMTTDLRPEVQKKRPNHINYSQ